MAHLRIPSEIRSFVMASGFRLRPPIFVHPLMFQNGRPVNLDGIFNEDGSLSVCGQRFDFAEPPMGLSPGTVLELEMEGSALYAYRVGMREERSEAKRREVEAAEESRRREERRRLAEILRNAAQENATLHIPVRWTSGQKSVMSGLNEGSAGDGRNKKTVNHVLLLDDIQEPRFFRHGGDFLCTSPSGSNGAAPSGLPTHAIGPEGPFVPQITCQTCLRVAHRWKHAVGAVLPELVLD